jgi:MFS family permease
LPCGFHRKRNRRLVTCPHFLADLTALAADPVVWASLAALIAMEVVLGIDNLIFISIVTNRLPAERRERARRVGIGLALILRLVLLGTVAFIVTLTAPLFSVLGHGFSWRDLILIAGGLFLVWKATKEIHHHVDPDHGPDVSTGRGDGFVRRRDWPDPGPRHVLGRQHHHRGRHDAAHPGDGRCGRGGGRRDAVRGDAARQFHQ